MHSVVALAKFMSLPLDISSDSLMFFFCMGALGLLACLNSKRERSALLPCFMGQEENLNKQKGREGHE